ncbi:MAG: ABC transporter permease [Methanomicrobiales archaeon]|jgi:hypothetical protein|nr:ABC transporter permease [Methanomicrobiales archaeon]
MTYLLYIAIFGAAAVFFLWIRDARIFARTRLPGYRRAAYYGTIYAAATLFGVFFCSSGLELLGLGIILGAVYLQGAVKKERVWKNESTTDRLLGKAPPDAGEKAKADIGGL